MKINYWSEEEINILRAFYPLGGKIAFQKLKEGIADFNRSFSSICTKAFQLKLKKVNRPRPWTKEELDILYKYYPISPATACGMLKIEGFQRTLDGVKGKGSKLGLSKLHSVTGQFKKGHVPKNKGKKQTEYMNPEQIERTKATRFKKGNKPPTHLPVGTITLRQRYNRFTATRERVKYQWIKVAEPNKWKMLHVYVWEQAFGPVEKGLMVALKDKNPMNCTLENLECITMKENVLRNRNRAKVKKTLSELPDRYVVKRMAPKDKAMQKELLNHPDLIAAGRQQIILKRTIKTQLQ